MVKYIPALFLLFIFNTASFSQRLNPSTPNQDSLNAVKARDSLFLKEPVTPSTLSYSRSDLQNNLANGLTPDTTLSDIHRINPVNRNSFASVTLGNIGLAEKKLYLYNPYPYSFRFRTDPYDAYYYHPQDIRFYDTKTPYTDLFFSQTGKKEQVIRISHSRSFKKYFNAGIDVQKIKSEGFYKRQEIDFGSADLHMRFRSRSGRYQAATAYLRNKAVVQENGGVDFDTVPLFFTGDKAFLPVNMLGSSNTTKTKNIFLDHTLFLGPKVSADSVSRPEVKPVMGITHSIAYDVKDEIYYDISPDQLNYISVIPPTGRIYDSLRVKNFSNTLTLHSLNNSLMPFLTGLKVYGRTETLRIGQAYKDTSFQNLHLGAEVNRNVAGFLNVFASGRATLSGYNGGDRLAIAGLETLRDSVSYYASVAVNSSAFEPDYMYAVSRSPIYKWHIDTLQKISLQEATGIFSVFRNKLSLRGTYSLIDNYTYLDNREAPTQHTKLITYYSASLHAHFTLARKWHFVHDILFQQASDTSIVHLPLYAARLTYFYNNRIFKKRLEVEAGVEINYSERFFSDAYAPGIRSFYLQSSIQGGGYPYVDIFFKFKVKNRARVFFKYEHVNSGFVYLPYFTVPIYPQADRKLKIGVSWKFYD